MATARIAVAVALTCPLVTGTHRMSFLHRIIDRLSGADQLRHTIQYLERKRAELEASLEEQWEEMRSARNEVNSLQASWQTCIDSLREAAAKRDEYRHALATIATGVSLTLNADLQSLQTRLKQALTENGLTDKDIAGPDN